MKIVFEFYGSGAWAPQATGGGYAYAYRFREPPAYHGGRVEIVVHDGPSPLKPDGDTLYIEGDLESVRLVGQAIVEHCALMEEVWREDAERDCARAKECSACGAFSIGDHGHADGRGNDCLGDGTVRIKRMVRVEGTTAIHASELLAGQQFTLSDPIGDADKVILTALENGTKDGVRVHWPPVR